MSSSSSAAPSHGNGNGQAKKRTRADEPSSMSSASSASSSSKSNRQSTIVVDDESAAAMSPDSSAALCNGAASAIASEYTVWRKNSPYLYDVVLSCELEWPSLTVQFFPDRHCPAGKDLSVQRLLLGTQTDGEQNHVMIAELKLPAVIDAMEFSRNLEHDKAGDVTVLQATEREAGSYGGRSGKLDVVQRIPHPSEVNRARYMPHNPDVIVTRGVAAELYIFDRTRYASKPVDGEPWRCDVLLTGHSAEGYGVSWSVLDEGRLLSCAQDGRICVWDINARASADKDDKQHEHSKAVLRPSSCYERAHAVGINDVAWHQQHPHLFASAADDAAIKCWDARLPTAAASASHTLQHHTAAVNGVAFSPLAPYLLASASDDHSVAVWDLRAPSAPLHTLRHHHDSVMQVAWSPFDASVLGSVSADRRANLYDVSRPAPEGQEAGAEDERLVFQHGGHTDKVGEMSWNAVDGEEWMIATVSDDNIVQVWQPAENVVGDDDGEEDEEEEEQEADGQQVKRSKAS